MRNRLVSLLLLLLLLLSASFTASANAETALKFTLDFIMFGPNAPFVYTDERGYFKEAGISIKIDPSSGSGDAVNRIASGAYDIGYADIGTLIEFASKNPDIAPKVVMFIQDRTPATILINNKSGIKKPADLVGHSLGSGSTDAGARMFPTFAKVNNVDISRIDRQIIDFRLRDSMFAQGRFDAIIAFADSLLSVRGMGMTDVSRMDYADWGLNFYGNAMIASRKLIESNPQAVRAAVDAVAKGWRDAVRNQKPVIDALVKRNNLANPAVDLERLTFIITNQVASPFVKANGIGAVDKKRFEDQIKMVAEAYNLPKVPTSAELYDDRFMPAESSRKF